MYFEQTQKRPFWCQEPNGVKRDSSHSFGAEVYENHPVFYIWNSFPYPRPPEGGQASPANFLTQGGRQTLTGRTQTQTQNCIPSSPQTPTPLTLLAGTAKKKKKEKKTNWGWIGVKKQKTTKKILFFLPLLSFSPSCASKPATLCRAPGLINMNQTGNDQREWEISKG